MTLTPAAASQAEDLKDGSSALPDTALRLSNDCGLDTHAEELAALSIPHCTQHDTAAHDTTAHDTAAHAPAT